jgi:bifunctional DNA-binding transcriptional regulator/antitoxin component of YhaV-PrlF toxin-antitoxin module
VSSKVGAKGNIVIDKAVRDLLGIRPGWEAVQFAREGHLEIHFLPPPTPGMSAGILRPERPRRDLWEDEALHEATERAMAEAAREKEAFTSADRE